LPPARRDEATAAPSSGAEPAMPAQPSAQVRGTNDQPQATASKHRTGVGQAISRRWQALRRHLPYVARRDARRRSLAYAKRTERFFAAHDPATPAPKLSAGEQVRVPAIWAIWLDELVSIQGRVVNCGFGSQFRWLARGARGFRRAPV
jgi:hypothetical protein